jgi:hypothetical protein
VRAEARKCRFCGYEFPPEETQPAGDIQEPERPAMKPKGCAVFGIALVIGALAYGAYVKFGGHATDSPPAPGATGIGDTATVRQGDGSWPCGSTTEALDELTKWAVRGDEEEVARTLIKTGSVSLAGGIRVKILDIGFGKRKVRVLSNDRECWLASEALTR